MPAIVQHESQHAIRKPWQACQIVCQADTIPTLADRYLQLLRTVLTFSL